MHRLPVARHGLGYAAVRALDAVVVRAHQVVRQVPGRHVLDDVLAVDDVAVPVEVLPPRRADRDRPVAAVVSPEELERVAARHDARALVVQQGCRVALQDGGVVPQRLQREPCR